MMTSSAPLNEPCLGLPNLNPTLCRPLHGWISVVTSAS